MKIKASHIRYIADKIVLDLINAKYIEILTNAGDINKIATKHLEENINAEIALEERVKNFMYENSDDIENNGVNEKQLFFLLKKRFALEEDFILVWEERFSALSHKIMDDLIDESVINFKVSEIMVKNLIFKSINTYVKAYKEISYKVQDRIKNYKKKLLVGTEEYELIYEKMYEEELKKQGFI